MAKITTTRYVVQWYRLKTDCYIDIEKFSYLYEARTYLLFKRSEYPEGKYRLVVEQESREVIG